MGKPRAFVPGKRSWCCYCKRGPLLQGVAGGNNPGMTATRDHVASRADHGEGGWVPCCLDCNRLKGALLPGAWFAFIDLNPGYWRDFPQHAHVLRWLIEFNRSRRARGMPTLRLHITTPNEIMSLVNRT